MNRSVHNHSHLYREGGMVRKLIEPDLPLSAVEAEWLRQAMLEYHRSLSLSGVPVPPSYMVEVVSESNQVVEHATDLGTDCADILKESRHNSDTVRDVLRMIVQSITGVLDNDQLGIDPFPSNFGIIDGKTIFLDFHPPRMFHGGVYLVGYPQPDDERDVVYSRQRYYSPLGIIRRLRFSTVRICGIECEELLLQELARQLPDGLHKQIMEGLEQLPDQRTRSRSDLKSILPTLDVFNVDDIREIALRIGSNGGSRNGSFLTDVYWLTTIDFRLPEDVRRERLEKAKSLILEVT